MTESQTTCGKSLRDASVSGGLRTDWEVVVNTVVSVGGTGVMMCLPHPEQFGIKLNAVGPEDAILQSVLDAGVRPGAILVTWEGHAPLAKAMRWTKHLRKQDWDFLGRKGWYFTYARAPDNP